MDVVKQEKGIADEKKPDFPTFEKIQTHLPETWETLPVEQQLDCLLKAFNNAVAVDGNWILVNGDLTLLQLLQNK